MKERVRIITEDRPRHTEETINRALAELEGKLIDIKLTSVTWPEEYINPVENVVMIIYIPEEETNEQSK